MTFQKSVVWLTLSLAACQGVPSEDEATEASARAEATVVPSAAEAPLSDASLYELGTKLVDQEGQRLELRDLAGKPVVVSMFYGTCPYACPMLIAEVKRIVDRLPPDQRREVRVLLVSFDPDRDTPVALKALATRHHLDPAVWRLARASEADVRDLANVLGIRYKKLANGAFNHSSVITLLDRRGVPRFRQDGLGDPPERAARVLSGLARAGAPAG